MDAARLKLASQIMRALLSLEQDGDEVDLPAGFKARRRGKDLLIVPPRKAEEGVIADVGPAVAAAGIGLAKVHRGQRRVAKSFQALHPRDRLGRFRDVMDSLQVGERKVVQGVTIQKVKAGAGRTEFIVNDPGEREPRQLPKRRAVLDASERVNARQAAGKGSPEVGEVAEFSPEEVQRRGFRQRLHEALAAGATVAALGSFEANVEIDKFVPFETRGDIAGAALGGGMESLALGLADVIEKLALMAARDDVGAGAGVRTLLEVSAVPTLPNLALRLREAHTARIEASQRQDSLAYARASAEAEALEDRIFESAFGRAGVALWQEAKFRRRRDGTFAPKPGTGKSAPAVPKRKQRAAAVARAEARKRDARLKRTAHAAAVSLAPGQHGRGDRLVHKAEAAEERGYINAAKGAEKMAHDLVVGHGGHGGGHEKVHSAVEKAHGAADHGAAEVGKHQDVLERVTEDGAPDLAALLEKAQGSSGTGKAQQSLDALSNVIDAMFGSIDVGTATTALETLTRLFASRHDTVKAARADLAREGTGFERMQDLTVLEGMLDTACTVVREAAARRSAASGPFRLTKAGFDPKLHPRDRRGKFRETLNPLPKAQQVRTKLSGSTPVKALQKRWAALDRDLLPYAGDPTAPEARQIIQKQKIITKLIHHRRVVEELPATTPTPVRDVVVIGAGPAGLSAAIYGGTEGMDTLLIDAGTGAGGQAGMSSRIENVLGFPSGVTGRQYAQMGLEQAQRVGAETRFGTRVAGLDYDEGSGVKTVRLTDGTSVQARSVVIAGGVQFRKAEFEGVNLEGVVYGDSYKMKQHCVDQPAVIVGGANSAGQAAIDTASSASHVTVLIRRGSIRDKMSEYLVQQLEDDPKVTILEGAEIDRADPDPVTGKVGSVTLKDGRVLPAAAVGLFIGSAPNVKWAGVELDERGFVEVGGESRGALETSIPGVFAAGDVRANSVHRVITAAADGAAAISMAWPGVKQMRQALGLTEAMEEIDKLQREADAIPDDVADRWLDLMDELDQEAPFTGGEEPPFSPLREAIEEAVNAAFNRLHPRNRRGQFRETFTPPKAPKVTTPDWWTGVHSGPEALEFSNKAGKASPPIKGANRPGENEDTVTELDALAVVFEDFASSTADVADSLGVSSAKALRMLKSLEAKQIVTGIEVDSSGWVRDTSDPMGRAREGGEYTHKTWQSNMTYDNHDWPEVEAWARGLGASTTPVTKGKTPAQVKAETDAKRKASPATERQIKVVANAASRSFNPYDLLAKSDEELDDMLRQAKLNKGQGRTMGEISDSNALPAKIGAIQQIKGDSEATEKLLGLMYENAYKKRSPDLSYVEKDVLAGRLGVDPKGQKKGDLIRSLIEREIGTREEFIEKGKRTIEQRSSDRFRQGADDATRLVTGKPMLSPVKGGAMEVRVNGRKIGRVRPEDGGWKGEASDGWLAADRSPEALAERMAARARGERDPLLDEVPGGPGTAVPSGIPSDTSPEQAVRNVQAALARARARRTPEEIEQDASFYDDKRAELNAYAQEHGLDPAKVIGAAATFSPGVNPKNDRKILDWLRGLGPDEEPNGENFPSDAHFGVRSFRDFKLAKQVLDGKLDPHTLLKRDTKRGEYLASIEGDPSAWTIDVHNWRDMTGTEDRDDLALAGMTPIQYRRYRAAMNAAGLGPRDQAIIWGDRRREGQAHGNTVTPEAVLGATPYYRADDPNAPRRTFADAKAMHTDPEWTPKLDQFRADARLLARKYGVRIGRMEKNVGVFRGEWEPSFAIHVTGDDANVHAFNEDLGKVWGQDAVVGFRQVPEGNDREVRFTNVTDPDALMRDLAGVMGDDAGASMDSDGSVRVFIGPDPDLATAVAALAKKHGTRAQRRRGISHYLETGGGGGRHPEFLPNRW